MLWKNIIEESGTNDIIQYVSYILILRKMYWHNLSCELRLHLGKNLKRDKGCIEAIKCKEYRSISILYICNWHKRIVYSICIKWVIKQWGPSKNRASTIWGADWDYFGTADHIIITLYPSPCCIQETSIVTCIAFRVGWV